MGFRRQDPLDRRPVEPFSPITTSRVPRARRRPRPVVVVGDPRPHRLHQEPHRLAADLGEALHAQHVRRPRPPPRPAPPAPRSRHRRQLDDEAREVVVVVLGLVVVQRPAVRRCRPRPPAPARAAPPDRPRPRSPGTIFTARPRCRATRARAPPTPALSSRSAFESTIRSAQATWSLEHLLDRVVVVERGVGGALRRERVEVGRDPPLGQRRAVDHRHHAVHRSPRLFTPGHWNACTSGFGSASPLVSIRIWSTRGSRERIRSSAGTKSSATVQQMQPLASSTMFSSGQLAMPQPFRISPSMPTSPNSLTRIASRRPPAFSRTCRISVVLPAPRKPVTTVQGTRGRARSWQVLQDVGMRDAGDEPALQRFGAAPERHEAVGRLGEEPGAGHEVGAAAVPSPPNT